MIPAVGSLWRMPQGECMVLGIANEGRPDAVVLVQSTAMKLYAEPLALFHRKAVAVGAWAQNYGLFPIVGALPTSVMALVKERRRQVTSGHSIDIDNLHGPTTLPGAAFNYLFAALCALSGGAAGEEPSFADAWPRLHDGTPWAFASQGIERDLVRAGALVLAQLEKMERCKVQTVGADNGDQPEKSDATHSTH